MKFSTWVQVYFIWHLYSTWHRCINQKRRWKGVCVVDEQSTETYLQSSCCTWDGWGVFPGLHSAPADWRRQLGHPRITWLSTMIQQDLKHHLTLPEAADLAQNRPVWRIMSTYGATQSHSCMPETTTTLPELTRIVYPACILHELFSHCYQLFNSLCYR